MRGDAAAAFDMVKVSSKSALLRSTTSGTLRRVVARTFTNASVMCSGNDTDTTWGGTGSGRRESRAGCERGFVTNHSAFQSAPKETERNHHAGQRHNRT
jgi:hypothetical protein